MNNIQCLGIPFDKNGSFLRGPALGPEAIRQAFFSPSANTYNEEAVDIARLLHFVGDLEIKDFEKDIRSGVEKALDQNKRLICLGGDHSITNPILQAYTNHFEKVSILHIDAHPDIYEDFESNPFSHASPFARILEKGLVDKIVQVGIRTATAHQRAQLDKYGVEVITMASFRSDTRIELNGSVYISMDIDALDPAFAPGVSHHEPGGMSSRELINFLQNQKHLSIIGGDIVELNPTRDLHNMTAMVAAKILKEMVSLMS